VLRVEFTVEPFVEGQPGRHVLAAVDAVRSLGPDVDFGPFASSFEATDDLAARALSALVAAAYGNGATHVSLQVERVES
jgi:hypothetical protein